MAADSASAWQVNQFCRIKVLPDASFQLGNHHLTLNSGEVLVDATDDMTISTPRLHLKCKKKSLLLFKLGDKTERCLVVWDDGADAVQVQTLKRLVKLGPGSEVIVSDHEPRYSEISANDNVGRRQIRIFALGQGFYLTKTEFSLVHVFDGTPLLHDLKTSSDPQDKAWKERIMKTAAILGITTGKHGGYAKRGW